MSYLDFPYKEFVLTFLMIVVGISALVLLIPFKIKNMTVSSNPTHQINERDIMFSRNELVEGTTKFDDYYISRPENKPLDAKFRAMPVLMKEGSSFFHKFQFASAHSNYTAVDLLQKLVDGNPSGEVAEIDSKKISKYLKKWSKNLGAVSFVV